VKKYLRTFLLSAAVISLAGGLAVAETLNQALASAYSGNPTIRAGRARQRSTDELVPQALSGWRPTISAEADLTHSWTHRDSTPQKDKTVESTTTGISIFLSQPLFRGFKTVEGTKAAESSVEAGRQNLLAVEQDILFQAVQAYMNVIRDRQVITLLQRNVSGLQQQLRAATELFNAGQTTRTDTAQARARLSQAQADLATSRAILAASIANYERIIGHPPASLHYPKIARLPKSVAAAQAKAAETNPSILAAAFVEDASTHQIKVIRGDLLPELSIQASASLEDDLGRDLGNAKSAAISGVLTIPIYEAGLVYSSVRQAKQIASQRGIEVIEIGRAVREAVASAWAFYVALGDAILSARTQVSAARLALDGVRQEFQGSRTTLDVLNAEAELTNAEIDRVRAERDRVVAAYQLLAAIGQLTPRHLKLDVGVYDVEENYNAVRDKWIGTDVETVK
jgi:outer membrane protein